MNAFKALAAATIVVAVATPASAKVRSQATITINAPIETVWALVVDVDRWPRWNKAVQTAHLEGPVARGSVFDWKSGGMGIRSTFQDIAPMERLSWTGRTLGTSAIHAWTFRTTDKGVVVTTTESFDGWLPAILPGTMRKMLDDTLPALLASLKVAAEKDARAH
jgi:uncharacterized protein YndB with AHSA1/START domain